MGQFPKLVGDRYPTSRYSVFAVKSVSGQICGQKFFAETHGGGKARKCEKNGDFACFRRSAHEAVTRSQTSRATSCATPRLVKMFSFFGQIRKWSNLWSKVFCRSTRRRKSEETREKWRFCELSAVGSSGGHTLPNHARYQLRYIPILFFDRLGGACFLFFPPRKALFGRKHRPVCRCPLGRRVC